MLINGKFGSDGRTPSQDDYQIKNKGRLERSPGSKKVIETEKSL